MEHTVAQALGYHTLVRAIEHLADDMRHPHTLHAISMILAAIEYVKAGKP